MFILDLTNRDDGANVLFAASGDFFGFPEIWFHTVISAQSSPETAMWEFFQPRMSTNYPCLLTTQLLTDSQTFQCLQAGGYVALLPAGCFLFATHCFLAFPGNISVQ